MNLLDGPIFLFMWSGFTLLMGIAIAAFFLWGIRSGQFHGQERARYLALDAAIPGSVASPPETEPSPPSPDAAPAKELKTVTGVQP